MHHPSALAQSLMPGWFAPMVKCTCYIAGLRILKKRKASNFRYQKNFIAHATLDLNGNLICDDDAPVISPCCEYDKAGIEDPRIVDFEGSYYIFYTCYDLKQARVGLSKTDDFIHYKRLGIVPAPSFDKDAFIFPERINHKIAYIHRIGRTIQIDYFDEMDDLFDKAFWKNYCVGRSDIMKSSYWWEAAILVEVFRLLKPKTAGYSFIMVLISVFTVAA